MKYYNVVAAVIVHSGKALCVQKGPSRYPYLSYKYEFPGGKIEPNETEEQALIREIQEEISITIKIDRKLVVVEHQYPDFGISLHTYLCSCDAANVLLTEHMDFKWLLNHELKTLDWAAADLPIVEALLKLNFAQ